MKKKQSFTLIELLVVIAIIAILAGLLLPTLLGASAKADVAKAKAEIKNLQVAISGFQMEYNKLPKPKNYKGKALSDGELVWLFKVLRAEDLSSTEETNFGKNPNTKKIKFYNGENTDMWGKNFQVVFEKSYDKGVETKVDSADVVCGLYHESASSNFSKFDVIIWSMGPDKKYNVDPVDKTNEDNIYNMETMWNKDMGHVIQK